VGATVYVTDTNHRWSNGKSRLLTTATTGPDGRFLARGVELTVWKPDPNPLPGAEEGRFQVAGTAPGFGFTWHEVTSYRPGERPRAAAGPDLGNSEAVYRGEPISVDLKFGPPATLRGKIVDDRGRPLAGVKVQVGCCDDLRMPGKVKAWSCARVDPTDAIPFERRAFDGIHTMPEELLSARTAADGTYWIDGLPRDTQFLTSIDPGPEYEAMAETIATADKPLQNVKSLGYDAVLDHAFAAPRDVQLAVSYSDTGLPANGATVRARGSRDLLRAGGIGTTDETGRTTLRLRPGDYELVIEPPFSVPYRPGNEPLKIEPHDDAKIAAFKLKPAAIVTLEAVDAKAGTGIEGVRFQYDTDTTRQRRDVASQLVVVDHPATDERGRLQAIVEPGRRRFFVESVPSGWKSERTNDEFIQLAAGREMTVRFAFTKAEQPDETATRSAASAIFPQELVEKWREQERLTRSGKFWVREYQLQPDNPIAWSDLEDFLNTAGPNPTGEFVPAILAKFPGFGDPAAIIFQIVVDGERLRNNTRYPRSPETRVSVANGLETIDYRGDSAQADIYDARNGSVHVNGFPDFNYRPNVAGQPPRAEARAASDPTVDRVVEADGRLTIVAARGTSIGRWVVDPKTGFVYAHSQRMNRARFGREVRQYGPTVFKNGAVLPALFVDATFSDNQVSRVWIRSVENVDLSYEPTPLDFVVAVPAGTVILDYRADRAHPKQGMTRSPIDDVVAFADGLTSRNRSIEPVLATGQPAPPLRPASWLDQNGPTAAPDLTGKLVLIDFWGISCGPCVAELPEVLAAAKHFVQRKDFALVGLHDSGATVEQVGKFATKRGLTYPIAIDRPAGEEGWFGATFKDYGVRGIPAAAVIDRQGKIVFVGRFREALQKAADLLAQ
jgi:thiol-disulfide isomerase/thioredoxin